MQLEWVRIRNFRSLKDVTIPGITKTAVFHGPNNTGKSNILQALKMIFAAKLLVEEVGLADEELAESRPEPRPTPFWRGRSVGFQENFHMGGSAPIKFEIKIGMPQAAMDSIPHSEVLQPRAGTGHNYHVELVGRIQRVGDDGEMILESVHINQRLAFSRTGTTLNFLPNSNAAPEDREEYVRRLLDYFTDCVYVIPSTRFLAREEALEAEYPPISAQNFKNWLHGVSLSREEFDTFEAVRRWFNDAPFKYGELSFLRDGSALDVMVRDGQELRMPIGAKGTGVQQILVLLGWVAQARPKVLCVEEPELNLSYVNQDAVITKLASLVYSNDQNPHQLLLTSHSDHIGSREDFRQYHVDYNRAAGTTVRRFVKADRLKLFPRSRGKRKVLV